MLIHEVCHAAVGDNIALDLQLRGHARGFDNCLAQVQILSLIQSKVPKTS